MSSPTKCFATSPPSIWGGGGVAAVTLTPLPPPPMLNRGWWWWWSPNVEEGPLGGIDGATAIVFCYRERLYEKINNCGTYTAYFEKYEK
jgi:hypothetical protein